MIEQLETRSLWSGAFSTVLAFDGTGLFGPAGPILADPQGNLYAIASTTKIFKLNPSTGAVRVLAEFKDRPGSLAIDSAGNIYGATGGGKFGEGTVFEIPAGSRKAQTLLTFNGRNGAFPRALTVDASGNVFVATSGTATAGSFGYTGKSSVIELNPKTGEFTLLAAFKNQLINALAVDPGGHLIGHSNHSLFRISGSHHVVTTLAKIHDKAEPGAIVVSHTGDIYAIRNSPDGAALEELVGWSNSTGASTIPVKVATRNLFPDSLVIDSAGNIFGLSQHGGFNVPDMYGLDLGFGTLFELPAGSHSISTLYEFNLPSGVYPGGLWVDTAGDLYGVTQNGGNVTGANSFGYGTVFKFSGSGFVTAG